MTAAIRHTERSMIEHLMKRYGQTYGNGFRYTVASHVRSAAGFDAERTCDFMAMDLWPSKGLQLIGHEIKVSRADWLCELRKPEKAEAFKRYCDRWFLVVPDESLVRPGELPAGWGMLTLGDPSSSVLRVKRQAPVLQPEPMSRTFIAAMLRAVEKTTARKYTDPSKGVQP